MAVGGGGGGSKGARGLLLQFSSLGSSKMEISETDFFDTLPIQNDQISYLKHVLAPVYVYFFYPILPYMGVWERVGWGLQRGLGHNLLMQFSRLGDTKMQISETDFFLILWPSKMIKYPM